MKKFSALLLVLCLTLALCACGQPAGTPADSSPSPSDEISGTPDVSGEPVEIIVFAAASMQETLTAAIEAYAKVAPNVKVTPSFESSGTLKTQIEEGADCNLFISAGQKQMNALDIEADPEKNPDQLDFVIQGTRVDILENKVCLAVPEGNGKNIESFDGLCEALKNGTVLFAMGNSDVPVGQYTSKILKFYNLDEEALAASGVITYGSNVKEVTTQVSEGTVDAGVIYETDAFSAGLTVVDRATADMCGQVIYPAALIKCDDAAKTEAAQAFLDWLLTDEPMSIFESVGFSKVA